MSKPSREDDLELTGSFTLLFVILGAGLIVLIGFGVYQRWIAKPAEAPHPAERRFR